MPKKNRLHVFNIFYMEFFINLIKLIYNFTAFFVNTRNLNKTIAKIKQDADTITK